MQTVVLLTLLLGAVASADQPLEIASPQTGECSTPSAGTSQLLAIPKLTDLAAPVQPVNSVPVVESAPPALQPSVASQPIEAAIIGQPHVEHVVHQHQPAHYAPAGIIQVVGEQPKPVRYSAEQYGQPESQALPANYKPFGSWGLYIGGNPADGYYTNYYKALSSSVADKQQVGGEPMKPAAGQSQAFSPILKQAGSSPYNAGDFYPFAYSPAELSSAGPVQHQPALVSPVQAGAQIYGSPVGYEAPGHLSYADSYASKKLGSSAFAQKEAKEPSKGYQSRIGYVYQSPATSALQPAMGQPQQVVAYPVPVGSQIVGSQPGVDGAFSPYGVHAFTRYAVKPTMVSSADQGFYYSLPVGQLPVYKQQVQQPASAHQSLSYYGYPMSQLHYSLGSIVPSSVQPSSQSSSSPSGPAGPVGAEPVGVQHQSHHSQVVPAAPVEPAASEKSESHVKPQHQKRA